MVAVLYKGSRVLSIGFNSDKTEPAYYHCVCRHNIPGMYEACPGWHSFKRHAEVDAIKKCHKKHLKGASIYVHRATKDGSDAMAKPCAVCEKIISDSGIKKVDYSYDSTHKRKVLKRILSKGK